MFGFINALIAAKVQILEQRILLPAVLLSLALTTTAFAGQPPVPAKKPNMLRTYRFTAKIFYNTGVTPLKVGTKLSGKFTYDLAARRHQTKVKWCVHYRSPRNKIQIRYRKLVFRSEGIGTVSVGVRRNGHEALSIASGTLKTPKGWRSHPHAISGEDKSYCTFTLQNSPARGMLRDTTMPHKLESKGFKGRTVVLDFQHGVTFPGGRSDKRATVYARIVSLQRVTSKQ